MTTNSENTPARRAEDHLPDAKIDWNKPEAPAVPLSSTAGAARQGGNTSDEGDFASRSREELIDYILYLRKAVDAPIPPLTAPAPLTSRQKFVNAMMENAEKWSGSAAPAPQQGESIEITDTDSARAFLLQWMVANFPSDQSFGVYIQTQLAGDFAYQLAKALAAKAAPAAPVQTLQTDLSKRLRNAAKAYGELGSTTLFTFDVLAAADEIDRYYGGMLAWKQTAEKKDRDWNAERMGRVNDRIVSNLAAPVQTADQGEPNMLWDAEDSENCYGDGPEDFANNYASNCMMTGEEAEVGVLCAYRGHNRTMRIVVSKDADSDKPVSWSWVGEEPAASVAAPVQAEQAHAEPVAWMNPETLDVIHDTRKRAWESDFGMGGKAKAAGYTCRLVAPALPAQAEQVEAVRAADEQFPIQNTDQARAFLTKWMRANFPTDRTFDRYIAEHLAGDFAWQLANALATKEAAAQVPAAEDVRAKALEDAAFICEAKQSTDTDWDTSFWNQAVQSCAHAIRNLAAPSTTPSNDTSALGDTGGAK